MYLFLNLVAFMILGLVPAVLFFVLAGRWDLWNAWTAAGIFGGWAAFATLVTYRTNPYLLKERMRPGTWRAHPVDDGSRLCRIQADVGQRVTSKGPYAIVRHPGYATILLSSLVNGLALNSLLSIIPTVIYAAITVRVTAIEDRMLHEELAGYAEYAAMVRYRLIPGVW